MMRDVSVLVVLEQRMLGDKFVLQRRRLYELIEREAGDGARSI
jgi:hypothetical protein